MTELAQIFSVIQRKSGLRPKKNRPYLKIGFFRSLTKVLFLMTEKNPVNPIIKYPKT